MNSKSNALVNELTDALFERKSILLSGSSGVGKTYIAKQITNLLQNSKYNLFDPSIESEVESCVISCHNSVTYEDVVGGIEVSTDNGKLAFEYKDKILLETIRAASEDYRNKREIRHIVIFDDVQRNDMSNLLGETINAIGAESNVKKLILNYNSNIEVTPNLYIICTYNGTEVGAITINKGLLAKFYTREILSDISYITEDCDNDIVIWYDKIHTLIYNYLDMQYRVSTYDQNRYMLGHGYFASDNIYISLKHQIIPLLKQYVAEGILDKKVENEIKLLEDACDESIEKTDIVEEEILITDYDVKDVKRVQVEKRGSRYIPTLPMNQLLGRLIEQKLLPQEKIVNKILLNRQFCYKDQESGGITYQAAFVANEDAYNHIGRMDGKRHRKFYRGGTVEIRKQKYYLWGEYLVKDYTIGLDYEKFPTIAFGTTIGMNTLFIGVLKNYYDSLIGLYEDYLLSNPQDINRQKICEYLKKEWNDFILANKEIYPNIKKNNPEAESNEVLEKSNIKLHEMINELQILWKNVGDKLVLDDGTEINIEGVGKIMGKKQYKEYRDVMEELEIKQMILQGPPGTSKTYSAKEFLKYVADDCTDKELADMQIVDYSSDDKYCAKLLEDKGIPKIAWDIVQFHPSYGYEDFIRGIKVSTEEGTDRIVYQTVNKVLGNIANLAKKHEKTTKFYLIIDEINRANLATVFGELIYGLEYRTEKIATPYEVNKDSRISLPDNLYIIGTMNTADKSIGSIDYAIRRRFLFFEQLPDKAIIADYKKENGAAQIALNEKASKLFDQVKNVFDEDYLNPEYRKEDVQIGHTYFLVDDINKLQMRFEYQIIPILKEYYKDGIISFDVELSYTGFEGFLNCIKGKINLSSEKEKVDKIFEELIS
ncbi:hypothetical protein CFOLD11_11560 [Clostridium folliculivorans]|uniref:AAA+ ATPase domain-containing protein n=1 Tax=Clostridium folliculivorans TaxID=2886038 RepID=A0A9W6D9H6_9CLOT|nr:AAA family ATPase [Clostridium folliculivorans]GKU24330.1 hypothetical protein CFOLD11_11560 [Clostridium folliculivorans]